MLYFFLISFTIFLYAKVQCSIIITTSGLVRGKLVTDGNVSYYAYQGIRYAEKATGSLRFKPPVPIKPWTDVFDATENGPVCPQPEGKYTKKQMSEDCLRVNIFVPATPTKTLRPTYFFIHGGGFKSNSGNSDIMYGPQFLMQRNIIFVSVNFRLGALGFLSFEDEVAPGNAGIKDVLLALKWVKSNIRKFGGNTITIGGQSSGAAIVHFLLLTEKSSGLFQRAVLASGSATNFRFFTKHPKTYALALSRKLGVNSDNVQLTVQNLTKVNVFDIIDAQENIYSEYRNIMRVFAPFLPCVEKESSHAILTRNPIDIIQSRMPQNIPILAGFNSQEGTYMWTYLKNKPVIVLKNNSTLCIPSDLEYPIESEIYKNLVSFMHTLYFGNEHSENFTLTTFYNLLSDTQYASNIDNWIRIYTKLKNIEPVYYYVFNFEGELNWAKLNYNISFPGVAHSDELGYMFVTEVTRPILKLIDHKSQSTLNNTLKYLSNFIKFGNPTPNGNSNGLKWIPCGKERHHILLNDAPEMRLQAPNSQKFSFWSSVYEEYYSYIASGGQLEPRIPPDFYV